ncbi:MAG: hypothetical protein ACKOCT_02445, partial [Alphaproteobacteria bacterium]
PAHPAWFETLAAGRPLGDLPPEEAEAISRLGALEGLGRTQALGTTAPTTTGGEATAPSRSRKPAGPPP